MLTNYGPTLKAFESLSQERGELFRADLAALTARHNRATDGSLTYDSGYVIVKATRRQGAIEMIQHENLTVRVAVPYSYPLPAAS